MRCSLLFVISIVLSLSGCFPESGATVTGNVTKAGTPLDRGLVTFRPMSQTQGPEFSGEITDGQYRVPKSVMPGDYWVEIRSWKKTGRIVKSPFGMDTEEVIQAIPDRYHGAKTELRASIVVGENLLSFDVRQ